MFKHTSMFVLVLVAGFVALASRPANAATTLIDATTLNGDFDADGDVAFNTQTITDWVSNWGGAASHSGFSSINFLGQAHSLPNAAFAQSTADLWINTTTAMGHTTADGDAFTLTVYAKCPDWNADQTYSAKLTFGAVDRAMDGSFSVSEADKNTWVQHTLTYTATAADAGSDPVLNLYAISGAAPQMILDTVVLTVNPIPEPSTLVLLATGLLGLLFYARRRRRRR